MADTATSAQAFDYENFLRNLTRRPGVYEMLDADGAVLYVGKARNLRARVSSYFRAAGLTSKTLALVRRIRDIRVTVTGTETEALLLEQTLIKDRRPPYNVLLRDDKSYPYVKLTDHTDFPRLDFYRGSRRAPGRYFGPFPSSGAVRETLNVLEKLFRLRNCRDSYFRNRSRPCLQYQIGRCSAPCVGFISPAEYAEDVRHAVLFLEGRGELVDRELQRAMETAAAELEFEQAARIRDQISQLRRVQQQQNVEAQSGDVDVIAGVEQPGGLCVQVMTIREGRLLGSREHFPKDELGAGLEAVLTAFVAQYYLAGGQLPRGYPREVISSHPLADEALIAQALEQVAERKVRVTHSVRGQRQRWLDMARDQAGQSLQARLAAGQHVRSRLRSLGEELGLSQPPTRLECFDISHTQGDHTVASCVVFDENGPLKSDYRRFNIRDIQAGDDYAAMEQALRRRYRRLQAGEARLPDVLLIDGGKGQLSQARKVLDELQVTGVRLVGVAKGPSRKAGLEVLIDGDSGREFTPAASSPGFLLVQHIRDEAHRFAITGHRQRRGKAQTHSTLEDIPGVGPARRKALIRHFGGARGVRQASLADLEKVPGISKALAEQIHATLHPG